MPDTGERHEITARVNAKEAETVQELKKLVSQTRISQAKERSSKREAKSEANRKRPTSGASPRHVP